MGLGLCGQLPSPVWMSPTLVSRWRRTDAPRPTVDGQGAALSIPVVLLGGHVTAEAPVRSRQSAPRGELLALCQD